MIPTNKTLIALAIMTTSLLTACGGSDTKKETTTTPTVPEVSAYKDVACKDMLSAPQLSILTSGSTCGYFTVPEKHALYGKAASSNTIEIAVVKLASTSANKKADPVVYLAGGPGGSASSSIGYIVDDGSFLNDRDVYLVDQRGTGYSKPALPCNDQITVCKTRLEAAGIDLDAYRSVESAMDFVELRKVLDIPQWNLYGISYGTRLATTIMRENSEGIRSVILDGMFPIEVNGITDTPWANYESLNQIVKNCDNSADCPADEFKMVIEDIIARMHNEDMVAESREFIQILLELGSSPVIIDYLLAVNEDVSRYLSVIETMMAEQGMGEGEGSAQEEQGEEDSFYYAMGLSTVCAEEYPFLNITALTGDNSDGWSTSTQVAVNGMFHMEFGEAACKAWDVAPANDIEIQAVSSNLPVLMLNGLQDRQTPAAWGTLVAQNMPNAQSITNPQGGHGQLFSGSTCFNTLASDFLAEPNKIVDASCVDQIPELTYAGGESSEEDYEVANFTFKDNDTSSDTVYMNGVIGSDTLTVMQELFNNYPQIQTIVMQDVPGSMDDDINLLASMEIRNRGINTHIPSNGAVQSGGTDMFLAGVKRTIETGAKIGVHSWSDGEGTQGKDLSKEHQEHIKYLDFYQAIGIPADFYWYTLEAAPSYGMHWMTSDEIAKYKVLTD